MKYAFITDVHSNLPALEAVLADIAQRGVHATYHLGDLVGYAPWPNETVDLLRQHDILGVAGNYDSTTATDYKHCGCKYEDPRQEALSHESYTWTRAHVSTATKRYLGSLPFRMDLRPLGGHVGGPRVVLIHGAPTLNTLYWTKDRPDSFYAQMAGLAGAKPGDVMVFGHTHQLWHRIVDSVHFLNAGTAGRPKDRDWRVSYALLNVGQGEPVTEFVRVEYDLERTVQGILQSDLPDEFAEFLRTGGELMSAP